MSEYKKAIIVLFTFIFILGIYIVYVNLASDSEEITYYNQQERILDIESENIEAVKILYNEDILNFTMQDKNLVFETSEDVEINNYIVSGIKNAVVRLNIERVVDEDSQELSQYGLSYPQGIITIIDKEGKESTLHIGNQTPSLQGYYAKLKSQNEVYIISESIGNSLLIDREILIYK